MLVLGSVFASRYKVLTKLGEKLLKLNRTSARIPVRLSRSIRRVIGRNVSVYAATKLGL